MQRKKNHSPSWWKSSRTRGPSYMSQQKGLTSASRASSGRAEFSSNSSRPLTLCPPAEAEALPPDSMMGLSRTFRRSICFAASYRSPSSSSSSSSCSTTTPHLSSFSSLLFLGVTPGNGEAGRVALWLSGLSGLYRRVLDGPDSVTDWVSPAG